jgi:predicted transcriptional regulator
VGKKFPTPARGKEMMTMTEKEKAIVNYMEKLKISREDAEQLWEDDQADFIGEEGEKMTENAKELRRYEKGKTSRKKMVKERKVDTIKKHLFDLVINGIAEEVEQIERHNEVSIAFVYNNENYSLKLTRHRKN